jgi:hypothetical protein
MLTSMAREESSREDLLREATALVERVEIVVGSCHVLAGFRADGALSIFFGEDPVYHFNAAGELRRAFCDGKLIKAVRGKLVALERKRTETEVQLMRHDLSAAEQASFLERMAIHLREFEDSLDAGTFTVVGREPPASDITDRVKTWFQGHKEWPVADRPNVGR